MMRYDEGYISRKMAGMPPPSYGAPSPYGGGYMPQAYPPMGPYGYGGYGYGGGYGGGYGAPPPPPPPQAAQGPPRSGRFDHYLEDDLDYSPRYRTNYKEVEDVEPKPTRALQDHVDKMRVRLKSLAYSLDPSGPVPDIVIPTRGGAKAVEAKKYSTPAIEYKELPAPKRYYPEDEHMKDSLRIRCLSQYKSTRTAAVLPDSSMSSYKAKYGAGSGSTRWDEPSSLYGAPSSGPAPYSKVEAGSSFFSTYGYTNRKKDHIGGKVKDYYYDGDTKVTFDKKAITAGDEEAPASEEKKERKKKKKSKEPEEPKEEGAEAAAEGGEAAAEGEEEVLDEKEKKKLEKKKRKAEREAAAKAAMEAELEALAAAEAELALLEGGCAPAPAAVEQAPAPVEEAPAAAPEPAVEGDVEAAPEPSE